MFLASLSKVVLTGGVAKVMAFQIKSFLVTILLQKWMFSPIPPPPF